MNGYRLSPWGDDNIVETVPDRLYRKIFITDMVRDLIATPEIHRLRHVAHLGLLEGTAGNLNTSASRFEHTLGVYHLASIATRIIPDLFPFRHLMDAAAMAHDMGSAPFTHVSEYVQKEVCGVNHEEAVVQLLQRSAFTNVLMRYGIDPGEVGALVVGSHPNRALQALINGPLDVDSIEGILRYVLAWHVVDDGLNSVYNPETLVRCFTVLGGELVLQPIMVHSVVPYLMAYAKVRQEVHNTIESPLIQGPKALIQRSLYHALIEGQLTEAFFRLTDYEAVLKLQREMNPYSSELIESVYLNRAYPLVFWTSLVDIPRELQELTEHGEWGQTLANLVCDELGIPMHRLAITTGRSMGKKDWTDLACVTVEGHPITFHMPRSHWYMAAYLHPSSADLRGKVARVIQEILLS